MVRVAPRTGDRILILKPHWLDLILAGQKTLEIRSKKMKGGTYFIGCGGLVYGRILLEIGFPIQSEEQWNALRWQHCCDTTVRPYKNTHGMPVRKPIRMRKPVAYVHPRGAIGIVKFRAR